MSNEYASIILNLLDYYCAVLSRRLKQPEASERLYIGDLAEDASKMLLKEGPAACVYVREVVDSVLMIILKCNNAPTTYYYSHDHDSYIVFTYKDMESCLEKIRRSIVEQKEHEQTEQLERESAEKEISNINLAIEINKTVLSTATKGQTKTLVGEGPDPDSICVDIQYDIVGNYLFAYITSYHPNETAFRIFSFEQEPYYNVWQITSPSYEGQSYRCIYDYTEYDDGRKTMRISSDADLQNAMEAANS